MCAFIGRLFNYRSIFVACYQSCNSVAMTFGNLFAHCSATSLRLIIRGKREGSASDTNKLDHGLAVSNQDLLELGFL